MMVVKRFLESFGFQTLLAQTAEKGIEIYGQSIQSRNKIGLILMDINLPGMDGITAAEKIIAETKEKPPPIISMSADGSEKNINRAMKAGIDSFLIKPIKQSLLFDTTMEIFGFKTCTSNQSYISGLVYPEEFSNISVLLVEDNAVNQLVATEILQSAGVKVKKADSGKEAIEMVKEHRFDAVLMDVQMPEMDGLESTKFIRKKLLLNELPIIAMTANAMYGDREKCLLSGMNDYVPKPIDRKDLFSALRNNISSLKNISQHQLENISYTAGTNNKLSYSLPGLELDEGIERLGGSWQQYINIINDFCRTYENFSKEMRTFLGENNFKEARIKAHSLKGAAGNISAIDVKLAAQALEKSCVDENMDQAVSKITTVEDELFVVKESLEKLNSDQNTSSETSSSDHLKLGNIELKKLINKLKTSIEDFDPVQSESFSKQLSSCFQDSPDHSSLLSLSMTLKQQIIDYEFVEAKRTLEKLTQRIK